MSAEKAFGSGGPLYAVDEPVEPQKRRNPLGSVAEFASKMVINAPKTVVKRLNLRESVSTLGELAAIGLISVGAGWYSLGAGFISGGALLLALSVATGTAVSEPEKR